MIEGLDIGHGHKGAEAAELQVGTVGLGIVFTSFLCVMDCLGVLEIEYRHCSRELSQQIALG